MKELLNIQQTFICPKDKQGHGGRYSFRSAEGIYKALKPLLKAEKCSVKISDEVVDICGGAYIKATATITNSEGLSESCDGWAKEDSAASGMNASQKTGSASSYARKYAICGLLLIDDEKDPDSRGYADAVDEAMKDVKADKFIKKLGNQETIEKLEAAWAWMNKKEKELVVMPEVIKAYEDKKATF